MGYRSTIVFGVANSNSSKLDEILKKYKMIPDEKVFRTYKNYKMIKDKHGSFLEWERTDDLEMTIYKFEYLKWYIDFPEVLAITTFLEDLYEEYEESKDEEVMLRDNIEAYPTIMIENDSGKYQYNGGRDADSILREFFTMQGGGSNSKKFKIQYSSV